MAARIKLLVIAGEDIHHRLATLTHLRSAGFDVSVAAPIAHKALTEASIPVFHFGLVRHVNPIADLCAMYQIRRIVKTIKPQIIHAYDTKPCYLAPLALFGVKGPMIVRTINGLGRTFSIDSLKHRILRLIYRNLHKIARQSVDYTIFQNASDMAFFIESGLAISSKSTLIQGSGIDLTLINKFATKTSRDGLRKSLKLQNKTTFIMVSRIIQEKGVFEYLNAAREIRMHYPDTEFLLIGPAAEDELGGISKEDINRYSDCVTFLGQRDDVPQLLNAADIFVLPSRYCEGVPRAMLEAMALSRPVIVSNTPGCREAVQSRGTGYLVPRNNYKELAKVMMQALNGDLLKMGAAGKRDINNIYSLPIIMRAIKQIYREII